MSHYMCDYEKFDNSVNLAFFSLLSFREVSFGVFFRETSYCPESISRIKEASLCSMVHIYFPIISSGIKMSRGTCTFGLKQ